MNQWMIAFLLNLYAIQGTVYAWFRTTQYQWSGWLLWVFCVLALLSLILAGINLFQAVRMTERVKEDALARCSLAGQALAMKLLAIPFFLIHLSIWTLIAAAFFVIPGFQILLLTVLIGVGFAYLAVLASSAYAVACIFAQMEDGQLSGKAGVLYLLSQAVFVLDVIGCAVFYWKLRRDTLS